MSDPRQERHFDLEADRRSRRNFTLLIIGAAAIAIFGAVALALWIIKDPGEGTPPPMPPPTKQEPPIRGFDPIEPETTGEPVAAPPPPIKDTLDDRDVNRGISRIQAALDKCAVKFGAIDGTVVTVDFSVGSNGRVTQAVSRPPHSASRLGPCVANVIKTMGKFKRTRTGLRDVHRRIRLRREEG